MAAVFECQGHLPGTTDEAWAVLADYGGLARWVTDVDHTTLLTTPPVGVGSVRRAQVGRTVLTEHLTEWVPGESLGYDIQGLPPVIRSAGVRWELHDHSDHTDVTVTVTLEPANPAAQALLPALRRKLSRTYLDMIDDLTTHLAARPEVTA
ncbi:MAG: SRPBCC family protein [Acidimicrobiales bacterium]